MKGATPRRGAGFTLVEIMIVVIILGLLTAIALPSIAKARQRSQLNRAKADLRAIAGAVHLLVMDTARWPGGITLPNSQETWDLTGADAGLITNNSSFARWNGPYIRAIPLDPWGVPYFFDPDYTTANGVEAVVGSSGPNRSGHNVYDSDNIYEIVGR